MYPGVCIMMLYGHTKLIPHVRPFKNIHTAVEISFQLIGFNIS